VSSSFPVPIIVPAIAPGRGIGAPGWLRSFGDGSDGVFNPSVSTTLGVGENWFTSVNIPAGVTVTAASPAGQMPLVIRATQSIVLAGTLRNSASFGAAASIVGGGSGGGGGGGTAAGSAGIAMVNNGVIISAAGAAGAAGGGNGGNAGLPAPLQFVRLLIESCIFQGSSAQYFLGGIGAGAGGTSGGAGGLGGAAVMLVAPSISFTGLIDCSGGAGAASPANNSGAGGGGGGGVVALSSQLYPTLTGTVNVAGGAGGSHGAFTGAGNGGSGAAGTFLQMFIQ